MFTSHMGDIMPSGFSPIRAGNVRTDTLADVYRDPELFRVAASGAGSRSQDPGGKSSTRR